MFAWGVALPFVPGRWPDLGTKRFVRIYVQRRLPGFQAAAAVSFDQGAAVRAECHHGRTGVLTISGWQCWADLPVSCRVPQSHVPVSTRAGEQLAVRAERHRDHTVILIEIGC